LKNAYRHAGGGTISPKGKKEQSLNEKKTFFVGEKKPSSEPQKGKKGQQFRHHGTRLKREKNRAGTIRK